MKRIFCIILFFIVLATNLYADSENYGLSEQETEVVIENAEFLEDIELLQTVNPEDLGLWENIGILDSRIEARDKEMPVAVKDNKDIEDWQSFSPEKKKELIERFKKFKALPDEERRRIKNNLHRYKELSPGQRKKIKENFNKIRSLNPEERRRLHENYRKWQALASEEKKEILNNYARFKQMPAQERKRLLENKDKWQAMPSQEKERLKDGRSAEGRNK